VPGRRLLKKTANPRRRSQREQGPGRRAFLSFTPVFKSSFPIGENLVLGQNVSVSRWLSYAHERSTTGTGSSAFQCP